MWFEGGQPGGPLIFRVLYMVVVGKHFTFSLMVVWWEIPT